MAPKILERSELEYLRSENKRLRSENRNLKKQVNRTNKKVKAYEENIEMADAEPTEEALSMQSVGCPSCGGAVVTTDLGSRLLTVCSDCAYRKTIRK